MMLNGLAVLIVAATLGCMATASAFARPDLSRASRVTAFALLACALLWAIYRLGTNW
jgi:hypothetical protein